MKHSFQLEGQLVKEIECFSSQSRPFACMEIGVVSFQDSHLLSVLMYSIYAMLC